MMSANHAGLYLRENKEYIRQTEKHFCSYLYSRALFTDTVRFPAGIRYNEDLCFLFLASRSARHIMQYEKPWFVYRMNSASVMYNLKKADYVLEAIDGLEICRKSCAEKKDISDCEGNIFACMVKYIRLACMYGTPVSEILKNVAENEPLQKVLVHYGTFWVNEQTAQLYDSFMKEPKKIWVKYRAKGILYIAVKRLIRTRPGEIINQKIRYKLALKDYLAE